MKKLVEKLCRIIGIEIDQQHIEVAHRLGNKSIDTPVIARFSSVTERLKILKKKKKFREVGVLVLEDYPPEIVQRRRVFGPVLRAAYTMPNNKAFLSVDKLVLNGKTYSHKELHNLPMELRPSTLATVTKGNITAFFSRNSELSNHFQCKFTTGEGSFSSVEQYLMYQKANYFSDNTAEAIRRTDDPVSAKTLGKSVKNFKLQQWQEVQDQYMQVGISAKFEQNPHLAKFLKDTGNTLLVEANPSDAYWGVGLSLFDVDIWDEKKWRGTNKLGTMLLELRDSL